MFEWLFPKNCNGKTYEKYETYVISDKTLISWKLIEESDLIYISENEFYITFKKLDSGKLINLFQLNYSGVKRDLTILKNDLQKLHEAILERKNQKIVSEELQKLSIKIDEIYYMPGMPGYFNSKNSFNKSLLIQHSE